MATWQDLNNAATDLADSIGADELYEEFNMNGVPEHIGYIALAWHSAKISSRAAYDDVGRDAEKKAIEVRDVAEEKFREFVNEYYDGADY